MKLTVRLAEPEAEYTVDVDARDRRAFERDAGGQLKLPKGGSLRDVVNALPETYVAWLAWHALTVRGSTLSLGWPQFDERLVEVVNDGDGDAAPDPTLTAPGRG